MRIALYEEADSSGRYSYLHEATDYMEDNKDYIRASDIVEIDFNMISDAVIIPKKVNALKAKKVMIGKGIDKEISKLLAITHDPIVDKENDHEN